VRISRDEWALRLAEVTALRGTCLRRRVGCVLVDAEGVVLATGYNGVPRGALHCNMVLMEEGGWWWKENDGKTHPHACAGSAAPSGTGLDGCGAIHAEQNALMFCADPRRVHACYVTASPCVSCAKMLLNTGCQRVVFRERYAQDAEGMWLASGRQEWTLLPSE
jgi:dCMP deaminase